MALCGSRSEEFVPAGGFPEYASRTPFLVNRSPMTTTLPHPGQITGAAKIPTRQRRLAVFTALWLTAQGFDTLPVPSVPLNAVLAAALLWILLPMIFLERREFMRYGLSFLTESRALPFFLIFLMSALVSAAFSQSMLRSVGFILLTVTSILIWSEVRGFLGHEFPYMLRWYALFGCLSLMPAFVRGRSDSIAWNRLTLSATDHPNHLAAICMAILVAALAWRSWVIRLPIIALMTTMIFQTGSRAHLVGSAFALLTYLALRFRKSVGASKILIIGCLVFCVAAAGIFHDTLASVIVGTLDLNNKYRGVDSGLSGRFDLWKTGADMFFDNPIIGVGFRVHDDSLPENIKLTAGSVHDGYLAMFIEVGVLGAIPFFVFLFLRILYVWREAKRGIPVQMLGMAFIGGLLVVALAQPLMLNLASPLPTLAWCFIVGPPVSLGLRAAQLRIRVTRILGTRDMAARQALRIR